MQSFMPWLRRLAWLLVALLMLLLLAWWGVPSLVKSQLPPRLSQMLGRPVSLGDAHFHPLQLRLQLNDLAIGAAAGTQPEPLLKVAQVLVNVDASSLRHWAPVIESMTIDGLTLRLARTGDGRYDIDDILARLAAAPAPKDPSEPTRFALHNLALRDAHLRLDDQPAGVVHAVEALTITLPFLSNLPSHVEVHTEPRLAFTLHGTRFDSGSQALPFAQTRSARLTLAFQDFKLQPLLPYLPASLPVKLLGGQLSSDLSLNFSAPPQGLPTAVLQGKLALRQVALADPTGAPLLNWQDLGIELLDVQPLKRQVGLGQLRIAGARLQLNRNRQGQINLLRVATAASAPAKPAAPASGPTSAAASPTANIWRLSLAGVDLQDAQVHWHDDHLRAGATFNATQIGMKVGAATWPLLAPVTVSAQTRLTTGAGEGREIGQFKMDGQVSERQAQLALQLTGLELAALSPYMQQALQPRLSGRLQTKARLTWADQPASLSVLVEDATVQDLQLRDGLARNAAVLASMQRLQLADTRLDLNAQRVDVAQLRISQPLLHLARDAQGQLNVAQWVPAQQAARGSGTVPPAPPGGAGPKPGNPWQVSLRSLAISGGRLSWRDDMVPAHTGGGPMKIAVDGLKVQLQQLTWPPQRGANPPQPRLQLSASIGAPGSPNAQPAAQGAVDWTGRFGLAPLRAEGRLKLQRWPLHLLAPYAGAALPVQLVHADANLDSQLRAVESPSGWQVATEGDLQLNDLMVHSRPATADGSGATTAGNELLSWQTLSLQGLQVGLNPAAKPRVDIREVSLTDFYSRLVITEQGRFNLQDVAAADAAPSRLPEGVSAPQPPPAPGPAASAASAPAADFPIDLAVGGTVLRNGRVDFTDRFVRPNYSARLTELNGQISALRSGTRDMATITLKGRAADTALVDISGQLNPTAQPLALDIRAKATDLELAPLSPYAGKYAGYAIERGKLSMDVAYKIDDSGRLDAKNQVILNQLTFGERVESPSATQLPVLLAVALLKDRHGVIDINLPVSGTLDDPQFSVGGIIWKVIVNLLGKALTAPFSLLSGGGSDDLSLVEFRPGTAQFTEVGRQSLAKVAKALVDRPSLIMTVTGSADTASERDDVRRTQLEGRLAAERRRAQVRATPATPAVPAAPGGTPEPQPAMSVEERTRLLKVLYQQASIPDKPRNAIGLVRDLPAAEMEALLLRHTLVTDDTARELALQRGLAVRDALIATGLPSERLFLAAPKLRVSGEADAAWTPRVQLSLSAR